MLACRRPCSRGPQTGIAGLSFNVPPGTLAPGIVHWRVVAITGNGVTAGSPDRADFAVVAPGCPSDIDGHGSVTVTDFLGLLGRGAPALPDAHRRAHQKVICPRRPSTTASSPFVEPGLTTNWSMGLM